MITPEEMLDARDRRIGGLTRKPAGIDTALAALAAGAASGLPRSTGLESEYLRAVTAAELEWVRPVVDDLRAGRLAWSAEELLAFAEGQEPALDS